MTFSIVLLLFTYYSVIITEEERATALLLMRKDTTTVSIVSTVTDIVRPVVEGEGLDLWAVEFKKEGPDYYLRVFIDKDGGVGINDCENVSRKIDVLLDEADPIEQSYILEVSSAGLVRELKTDKHLLKFLGYEVEVRLFKALDGTKKLTGKLENFTSEEITLLTENEIKIPRKDISKIIVDLI